MATVTNLTTWVCNKYLYLAGKAGGGAGQGPGGAGQRVRGGVMVDTAHPGYQGGHEEQLGVAMKFRKSFTISEEAPIRVFSFSKSLWD